MQENSQSTNSIFSDFSNEFSNDFAYNLHNSSCTTSAATYQIINSLTDNFKNISSKITTSTNEISTMKSLTQMSSRDRSFSYKTLTDERSSRSSKTFRALETGENPYSGTETRILVIKCNLLEFTDDSKKKDLSKAKLNRKYILVLEDGLLKIFQNKKLTKLKLVIILNSPNSN